MDKQLNLNTGAYALDALDNDERADFERYALTRKQPTRHAALPRRRHCWPSAPKKRRRRHS